MDERCKKLQFRAWRRGFREIDLILGGFADRNLATLDPEGLAQFEHLLDAPDQMTYAWIVGFEPAPKEYATPILEAIRAFVHGDRNR